MIYKSCIGGAIVSTAWMAMLPAQRAMAQASTLTTEPLVVQQINAGDTTTLFGVQTGALGARVKVNINNDNVRDAIKKLIGKAEVTYEIDDDVPADARVSIKADNIQLATAINVLTESAGIGCTESIKSIDTDANGKHTGAKKVHLHFKKTPTAPLGAGASSWLLSIPTNLQFNKSDWTGNNFTFPNVTFKGADGNTLPGTNSLIPKDTTDYKNKVLDNLKIFSTQPNGAGPLLYNLTTSEERSTFTCPHCKQQVTILKKHVAPKCPTCGRTFQSDWKFCPVDGTKRPDDSGDWKFCPHCGKPVSELTIVTGVHAA